jgi:PRC-barrel domain
METSSYASRLRYLDADDVDDSVVDFDGLEVRGREGDKLGEVNGFIVDLASGRVLYVVVDSGGWFRSRRFLAPIGHAVIDHGGPALSLDIAKERLHEYPEFVEARFSEFTDADLEMFEARTSAACCPEEPANDSSPASSQYETRRHYQQPQWWTGGAYVHQRLRPVEAPMYRISAPTTDVAPDPARDVSDANMRDDRVGRVDRSIR